jgi:hypothetical protein
VLDTWKYNGLAVVRRGSLGSCAGGGFHYRKRLEWVCKTDSVFVLGKAFGSPWWRYREILFGMHERILKELEKSEEIATWRTE